MLLDDKGHTEWMRDDDPTSLRVRVELLEFFGVALRAAAPSHA